MYRNKKDVDKHVEDLKAKLSSKEFKSRAFSFARLYYDAGDYNSCQIYVEQYLTYKYNNAAAHKLLGQSFLKLNQKDKAVEEYKLSLSLDPNQNKLIIDVCELLADEELIIDVTEASSWCNKLESSSPLHPVIYKLRERILAMSNASPEDLVKLLETQIANRPKDVTLHARLIKHYLQSNKHIEALKHSWNIELSENSFLNNSAWYETLNTVLKFQTPTNNWRFHFLELTVRERLCHLSLSDQHNSGLSSKSITDCCDLLHQYDQTLHRVHQSGPDSTGLTYFHSALLQHHRGQFSFYAANFILKKAKKDQLNWREALKDASPFMLLAYQTPVIDKKATWLLHSTNEHQNAVTRWCIEGSYRCSQSGHYLLDNYQENSSILDTISQICSGIDWKHKLYKSIFMLKEFSEKVTSSYLISTAFVPPIQRLPRKHEVELFDEIAQRHYPNSLHHLVWVLLNYKNFAHFKFSLFDMLTTTSYNLSNCGPENLCKLDCQAFLYTAALCAQRQLKKESYIVAENNKLPANLTNLLCTLPQMKWWDCVYKFSQNELNMEMTDIRATVTRGIEVVRCIDNHGLDPELLCQLGRIFNDCADINTKYDDKTILKKRAELYYLAAIPILEKMKKNFLFKLPEKRIFEYPNKQYEPKDLTALLEESKLFVGIQFVYDNNFEKAIEMLTHLKTSQSYYYLSQVYKSMALDDLSQLNGNSDKLTGLLLKAKMYALKTLEKIKDFPKDPKNPSTNDLQNLIDEIEQQINIGNTNMNLIEYKGSSDDDGSINGENNIHHLKYQYVSSTPKSINITKYKSAFESQIHDHTNVDQKVLERIEQQIKLLQKRFNEQSQNWCDENRASANQIMRSIDSIKETTSEQFKVLKMSIDQLKTDVVECRSECKDVTDLKKQIAELKQEVMKLKKSTFKRAVEDSDSYNLGDEYLSNEGDSAYTPNLPYPSVIPPYNQRVVQPLPFPAPQYQLYGQNLLNLYNNYSQFPPQPPIPGGPPLFDNSRPLVNYPGVHPISEQLYSEIASLIPPQAPPTAVSVPTSLTSISKPVVSSLQNNEQSPSMPVNVVITTSDPLPTSSTKPTPVLSVTVPAEHKKGSPHNYQISMPIVSTVAPPFSSGTSTTSNSQPKDTLFQSPSLSKPSASISSVFDSSKFSFFDQTDSESKKDITTKTTPVHSRSHNDSRTLSETSTTSVENYDPCPDFKPIIPLPDKVQITTGEEDELELFSARAKLFRFTDKQWKERGLGQIKLLQHKVTKKVRVLMRREQVHKICANHLITPDIDIQPMKNETKAYIWVANDYSEEKVILEKFCVRFKTPEIALQFYEEFKKACKVAVVCTPIKEEKLSEDLEQSNEKPNIPEVSTNKTVLGGFTFSSTPTFKVVNDIQDKEIKPVNDNKIKENPFMNIAFKVNNPSFDNLTKMAEKSTPFEKVSITNKDKLNTSDTIEEFEPTVDFTPVIPLPALVDMKTGEEDEMVLFEHRAKLLRFHQADKEWKESGVGNIKILINKEDDKIIRLLMRREQVMKVCCNHALTKEMTFQKMPNLNQAVTWCAKDYSEGKIIPETFCLRFKTVEICDEFMTAIKLAQSKMNATKDEIVVIKAGKSESIGFGDQFKPKEGSWHCETCYTNNLDNFNKCACCQQPKPQIEINMDKFKPKAGSWECKECLIRNEEDVDICNACRTPKDGNKKNEIKPSLTTGPKFNFGIPSQTMSTISNQPTQKDISSTWGVQFKPKPGTWECQECFIRNEDATSICTACSSPKVTASSTTSDNQKPVLDTLKFNYGIPQVNKSESNTTSIFDGTGAHKFTFGIPSKLDDNQKTNVFGFGTNISLGTETSKPVPIKSNLKEISKDITPQKSMLLPTPQAINIAKNKGDDAFPNTGIKSNEVSTPISSNENRSFDFVFKTKVETPIKSPKQNADDDSDEQVTEDEGNHIHFSPVVPLPDKIDVVTGEENESELYCHRAKLFRFTLGEWKERGLGNIKILKHKDTGKLRVLMRREQIHKICLNHSLTSAIKYTKKDEKTWLFATDDFSEGKLMFEKFCVRFKTNEIATQFKDAVDNAVANIPTSNSIDESDDVTFVKEIQSTDENKILAKKLMLPENFFNYVYKSPCKGCRGCIDNDDVEPGVAETPAKGSSKSSTSSHSPNNTVFLTPITNKGFDTSVFRTPLDMLKANNLQNISGTNIFSSPNVSNKENTSQSMGSIFSGHSENELSFTTSPNQESSTLGTNSTSLKKTVLAAPKLNPTVKIEPTNSTTSIFGSKDVSINNTKSGGSIFASFKTNNEVANGKTEVKSVFGDIEPRSNIFMGSGSIFGSNISPKPSTSIFSSPFAESISSIKTEIEPDLNKSTGAAKNQKENQTQELPLPENTLSFSSLSGTGKEFKSDGNFKWSGAGQQLFGENDNKSQSNSSKTGETGEEYDPHYEPIVPLPKEITVTTGEEDEQNIFQERCKLYRFVRDSREWKERGVGELKVLFHPTKNTYRMLMRRDQIHKAVLNMLLHMDFELLPNNNSDRAWTWAGLNYAESSTGEQEMLTVRFKTKELADKFKGKVDECIQKLQAASAHAERDAAETVAHQTLRLPKGIDMTTRADTIISAQVTKCLQNTSPLSVSGDAMKQNGGVSGATDKSDHVAEQNEEEQEEHDEDEDVDEENDEDNYQNYVEEYEDYDENEEVDETGYDFEGGVEIEINEKKISCANAHVQVHFDENLYAAKMSIEDLMTGEIYVSSASYLKTEFNVNGAVCSWNGIDLMTDDQEVKYYTVTFPNYETATEFGAKCDEIQHNTTYTSTDPES